MRNVIYILLLFVSSQFVKAQSDFGNKHYDKAMEIIGFVNVCEWENNNSLKEIRLGLLETDSLLISQLKRFESMSENYGRPIKFIYFKNLEDLFYTEALFVNKKVYPEYVINSKTKNTLVIADNSMDFNNAMISMTMVGRKVNFVINEVNLSRANLKLPAYLKISASKVITEFLENSYDLYSNRSANDKLKSATSEKNPIISFTNKEVNDIRNAITEQTNKLVDENRMFMEIESKFNSQSKKVEIQKSVLLLQENEITKQQKNLAEQKNKIDEQLLSILTQEQKLKLQEQKLELTIQQNKIQEADLEIAKKEVTIQLSKINTQKAVLLNQQKDIDEQNKKLISQLGQINSQKTILYLAAFLVLIIAVALFIAYRGNKNKQRANALLSRQKVEIEHQRELVEEKQKEILDSINYAKRIQYSLLASDKLLNDNLPKHFLFFKPKDVVSGDFYWGASTGSATNKKFILVTADSTGHGVPGAIMSMLNISCLNESINADKLTQPADILNATRKKIIEHLLNDGSAEGGKDGMDCSLVSFDFENKKLIYAAANNPVWIIRDKTFIALAADRMPIGKHDKDSIPFTQHEFDLQLGDMIYTLTDGFPDQFGGPRGKKFMYKQLENLLISISHESMEIQKQKLENVFENWKGDLEQVDDVCVIGVRI